MATLAQWVEGARPRTLPAAIAPVLAGSGVAAFEHEFLPLRAFLALVVALALQIGVNFANDYSDGIRGTDANRVGPMRLVGSGAAAPIMVRNAAFACFTVAAVVGVLLIALTGAWWLILIGASAILSAWYYTGGANPYGYQGWGEVFVFVFFGLVAVGGTAYVQIGHVTWGTVWAAVVIGALACAILVANNLRDIAGDREVGKRTLATRLGDARTRQGFIGLLVVAVVFTVLLAAATSWWALLGLVMLPLAVRSGHAILTGAMGRRLIGVLRDVGLAELVCAIGLFVGLSLR